MKTANFIKTILASALCLFYVSSKGKVITYSGTGEIRGLVTDENHSPAIGVVVTVTTAGNLAAKTVTDLDGKYAIKPLVAGYYEVIFQQGGYKTIHISKVLVKNDEASYVDAELNPNTLEAVVITEELEWMKPMVDVSVFTMHSINSQEINNMAVNRGSINDIISNISSDVKLDPVTNQIHSRGARVGTTEYYIDGERVIYNPGYSALGIQSISIITGGIPAQYGDLCGGVVVITGKDYFTALAEKRIKENEDLRKEEELENEKKLKLIKENRKKEIELEKNKRWTE